MEEPVAEAQPSDPLPKRRPSHNLPLALSTFVGREREVAEVMRLVGEGETRLVTLTGPGGSGKTRLALAVAHEGAEGFEEGAWWVALASLSDPDLVAQAVASVLGVRETPGRALSEALVESLKSKDLLLILDNCEHLIEACAALADTLLRVCPNLTILGTSREALGIAGEVSWSVPPLPSPTDTERLPPSLEELGRYEAVMLFLERAKAASGFGLTEENVPAVVRLCRRLEGIPLAIELAAARTKVLSVGQIYGRLKDSLKLLAGNDRVAPARHRTLRGTLDWSYELLSEQERKLFGRLSVFAGGWELEAAEAVGEGNGIERHEVLDLLSGLVEKSLVVAEASPGAEGASLRYRMLEPVRQYARERLEESEEAEQVRELHAGFFLSLAEAAEPALLGPEQGAWLERLEIEYADFRAALGWALEQGDAELGLRLSGALAGFWHMRGHLGEGQSWLERGLTTRGTSPKSARAKALNEAGWIATLQGDGRAIALLEESMRLFRELNDKPGLVTSLNNLGWSVLRRGDKGHLRTLREEAEALRREPLDGRTTARLLSFLILAALDEGDYEQAVALLEESLALNRGLGDMRGTIICLNGLGLIALIQGDHERAAGLLEEDLQLSRKLGDKVGIAYSLLGLAGVAALRGQRAGAARLWGAAEALREAIDLSLSSFDHSHYDYEGRVAAARSQIDEEAWKAAWSEGRAMTPEEAMDYALSESSPPKTAPAKEDKAGLSAREVEVLGFVARGLTDPQVAEKLYLSRRTVNHHLRSIYAKLGASSRAAAAKEAVERGLI